LFRFSDFILPDALPWNLCDMKRKACDKKIKYCCRNQLKTSLYNERAGFEPLSGTLRCALLTKRGKNLNPSASAGKVNSAFEPNWWTSQQLGSHWSKHAARIWLRTKFRNRSNKTNFLFGGPQEMFLINNKEKHYFSPLSAWERGRYHQNILALCPACTLACSLMIRCCIWEKKESLFNILLLFTISINNHVYRQDFLDVALNSQNWN